MSTTDRFELTLGGRVIRCDLLTDQAPRICRAFQASLPLESFAVHAKFAGDELIAMLPFYADAENVVPSVAPGDIAYYPSRQTLCLFYGDIQAFASVSLFARVHPDDLELARAAGRDALQTGAVSVRLRLPPGAGPVSEAPRRSLATDGLLVRLRAATAEIWNSEPPDVERLRGLTRPLMGNLPCVLYANFDLFWAVENLHVSRRLVLDAELSVPQLAAVLAALLRQTQERLGKWGFPASCAVLEDVCGRLESEWQESGHSREDILALIDAVVVYLDRLQSWTDALIPWSEFDGAVRLRQVPRTPGSAAARRR